MTINNPGARTAVESFSFLDELSESDRSALELTLICNCDGADFIQAAREYCSEREISLRTYQAKHKGMGSEVHSSIKEAAGEWYMLLSGDDSLKAQALSKLLNTLQTEQIGASVGIVAYNVMEDELEDEWQIMPLQKIFPQSFTAYDWSELKRFRRSRLFTMNNSIFRTSLLKKSPLRMPEGSDLAEYVYSYLPLPYVKQVYYADYDLRYAVAGGANGGTEDITSKEDDLLRIARMLYDVYRLEEDIRDESQREYMYTYLTAIVSTCALSLMMNESEKDYDRVEKLWGWMRRVDRAMYRGVRSNILFIMNHMSGDRWRILRRQGIKLSKRFLSLKP
ncbi:MAG TPA: glycosyltransferase [Oscillospiraceae bacterium]|nr:glycosyltransferase [Oscillospiraceae bacterium]